MPLKRSWPLIAAAALMTLVPSRALRCDTLDDFESALADLKQAPDDADARRSVIELSQRLAHPPVRPEELTVLEGKASYLAKNAADKDDLLAAIKAYKKASLLAPWDAVIYFNTGVLEQEAALPKAAIRDFKWYLLAAPGADDHDKVLARIGKLDALSDAQAEASSRAKRTQALAALNAKNQAAWQAKKNGCDIAEGTGIAAVVVGLAVGAWGYGTAVSATRYGAPGNYSGVEYNVASGGSYFSQASYSQLKQGLDEQYFGVAVFGVGLVVWIIGAVDQPAPFTPQTALLNLHDGRLALGVPLPGFEPRGARATLLSAGF